MSGSLPRRKLLSSGAVLAASAVLTAPAIKGAIDRSSHTGDAASTVVVRWNGNTHRWAPRPPHAEFGVVFLSTNDPHATPPTDVHVLAGDVWRRHPDAKEMA